MRPRLGINVDHVATLRQARGEQYPSVVEAGKLCLEKGADQLTIHLREDRRHIQEQDLRDLRQLTKAFGCPLNLEMSPANEEILHLACEVAPDWICLVPENRQERTTEGGLNLLDPLVFEKVAKSAYNLKKNIGDVSISLFLEARSDILERAQQLKDEVAAVEIHTGDFARLHLQESKNLQENKNRSSQAPKLRNQSYRAYLADFKSAREFLEKGGQACHGGHGLTRESVRSLLESQAFVEYNIGHWVISQALFEGLAQVVEKLVALFEHYPIERD